MQQLIQYAEFASLVLTLFAGMGAMAVKFWLLLDHGKPDTRREWLQRAVSLAASTQSDMDTLLKVGANTPIEEQTAKQVADRASSYLKDHGINVTLDPDTVRLILTELRKSAS